MNYVSLSHYPPRGFVNHNLQVVSTSRQRCLPSKAMPFTLPTTFSVLFSWAGVEGWGVGGGEWWWSRFIDTQINTGNLAGQK